MKQNCEGIVKYNENTKVSGILFDYGDILLANIRPYLKKSWYAEFNGACSSDVLCVHPYDINKKFLSFVISNDKFFSYIMTGAKGSKMPRGDKQHIMQYEFSYPNKEEQEKIADFLSLIDKRIEKQRQLVENLKKYKRGLLSAIFDEKISLNKNEIWNGVQLSKILKERKIYYEKNGTYEHATLSKEGVSGKTERYERDFLVSDENKKYKITKLGDICYNPANLKFGVICLNKYGNVIFSPIYVTFEIADKYNKEFIGYSVTRQDFINKALKYQQGTVYERMAVSPDDLLSMKIKVPSEELQNKISKLLGIFDAKLEKESNKLTLLSELKKSLLQQMFI